MEVLSSRCILLINGVFVSLFKKFSTHPMDAIVESNSSADDSDRSRTFSHNT